jgi:hypothetical protein
VLGSISSVRLSSSTPLFCPPMKFCRSSICEILPVGYQWANETGAS